jgi:hypothetical protein
MKPFLPDVYHSQKVRLVKAIVGPGLWGVEHKHWAELGHLLRKSAGNQIGTTPFTAEIPLRVSL